MGDESGFSLVSVFDTNIVIPPADVKFGENFGSLKFINEIRDEWKGICISDCVFIDIAVVLTGAETTIPFLNKEEGRRLWGH